MDQDEAKRRFVAGIKMRAWILAAQHSSYEDFEEVEEELATVSEHLWGCHDVLDADAPADALREIEAHAGDTYHDAVLSRTLHAALDWDGLEGVEAAKFLHEIFLKDQHARPPRDLQPQDDTVFFLWLCDHLPSADEVTVYVTLWRGQHETTL